MTVFPVGSAYEQLNNMPYGKAIECLSLIKVQRDTWEVRYRIDRNRNFPREGSDIVTKTVWAQGDHPSGAWSNVMKSEGIG
jgi:hypothetical protein